MNQLDMFSANGSPSLPPSSDDTGRTESSGVTSKTSSLIPTPSTRDWKGGSPNMTPRDDMSSLIETGATKNSRVLLSSPVASPANPSVMPDEDKERLMTATSGRTCLRLYETSHRNGSSLKTCVASLLGTTEWYSRQSALTWKAKATKSNRLLFQLSPSVRRTDEIGSGLLLTPSTIDRGERSQKSLDHRIAYRKSIGRNTVPPGSLSEQIATGTTTDLMSSRLIPTPTASLASDGQDPQVFMRQMQERRERTKENVKLGLVKPGSGRSMNLMVTVAALDLKTLKTPSASEAEGGAKIQDKYWEAKAPKFKTRDQVGRIGLETGVKLRLQPAMTQWMMGYPDSWTEFPTLEPNGEKTVSKLTETGSSTK